MNRFLLSRLRENEAQSKSSLMEGKESLKLVNTNFEDNHGVVISGGNNNITVHINDGKVEVKSETKTEEAEVKELKELPKSLCTDIAQNVLGKLQSAGYLDETFSPVGLSLPQVSVVAYMASDKIWGETKWKPFEEYWEINNIKSYYQRAMSQKQTGEFMVDIKKALQ